MPPFPQDKAFESSPSLLRDGYTFIAKRSRRYQSELFEARLLFQKTICMTGEAAARLFYDDDRFQRKNAAPSLVEKTLFGEGGVQGLDDEAHRHRKQMFMTLMTPESIRDLTDRVAEEWYAAALSWERTGQVILFDEAMKVLFRAVCSWTGVPLSESDTVHRTREIGALIEGPGSIGLRHWRGRLARMKLETWAGSLIDAVREHRLEAPEGRALHTVATYRTLDGAFLNSRVGAVELLNVLRPTVAVARYITFIALALHRHPEFVERIVADESGYRSLFVQEVRRFYPFFPFVAARVRKDFEWNGYYFLAGKRVLLDLYGTNHNRLLWEDPEVFRPERFLQREVNPFNLIPQGGGNHYTNHRCPGESITIEIMKTTIKLLTEGIRYEVPEQDLRINLSRMPAIPASRFVIDHIQCVNPSTIHPAGSGSRPAS